MYKICEQSEIVKVNVFVGGLLFRTINMKWDGQHYMSDFEPIAMCLCEYHVISFRPFVIVNEAKFHIVTELIDEDLVNKMKRNGIKNILTNELYVNGFGSNCGKQYKAIEHVYEFFWTC